MALATLALATIAAAAQAQVEGTFLGLGEARGMTLELERRGELYSGALTDADGARRAFEADAIEDGAETVTDLGGGPAYVRIKPESVGVALVVAPIDAEGAIDARRTRALAFRREDVALPPPPKRFLPAPQGPVSAFDARAFVDSYPYWEPLGAAWAYEAVSPALRTVIRLFPAVQTDLLWKLCQSPRRTEGLAEALRGQGVTCQQVNAAMRRAQAGDGFNRYVRDVAQEREALIRALGCAENYARNRDRECSASAADTAQRAISMETAASVLRRYQ